MIIKDQKQPTTAEDSVVVSAGMLRETWKTRARAVKLLFSSFALTVPLANSEGSAALTGSQSCLKSSSLTMTGHWYIIRNKLKSSVKYFGFESLLLSSNTYRKQMRWLLHSVFNKIQNNAQQAISCNVMFQISISSYQFTQLNCTAVGKNKMLSGG